MRIKICGENSAWDCENFVAEVNKGNKVAVEKEHNQIFLKIEVEKEAFE